MLVLVQLALAALVAGADPTYDTVFLQNGGRLRGVVVEDDPKVSVTIQLPGGELRKLPAAEVLRIEYREKAATTAMPPPPAGAPGEPQAPLPPGWSLSPSVFTLAMDLGWARAIGNASSATAMSDLTHPQFAFGLEGGWRLSPAFTLGAYLDFGVGDTGSTADQRCHSAGFACDAYTLHAGGLLRYAFTPQAPSTAWIAAGTGYESTDVAASDPNLDATLVTFSGWEFLRLSAGYDVRGNGGAGFGVYFLAGMGRYSTVEDATGRHDLSSAPTHGWVQICVRSVLGP